VQHRAPPAERGELFDQRRVVGLVMAARDARNAPP